MSTKSKKHRAYHGSMASAVRNFIKVLANENAGSFDELIPFLLNCDLGKHEHIFYFTDKSYIQILYDPTCKEVDGVLVSVKTNEEIEDDEDEDDE